MTAAGALYQPLDDPLRLGLLEIEREGLLVAVDAEEIRAFGADERRSPPARIVAAAGLLDLDHARAHVGEQHRAERARQHAREVDDEQAFQWRHNRPMADAPILVYAGSS